MPFVKRKYKKRAPFFIPNDLILIKGLTTYFNYFRSKFGFQLLSLNETSIIKVFNLVRKAFVHYFIRTFFCSIGQQDDSLILFGLRSSFSASDMIKFQELHSLIEKHIDFLENVNLPRLRKSSIEFNNLDANSNVFLQTGTNIQDNHSIKRIYLFVEEAFDIFQYYIIRLNIPSLYVSKETFGKYLFEIFEDVEKQTLFNNRHQRYCKIYWNLSFNYKSLVLSPTLLEMKSFSSYFTNILQILNIDDHGAIKIIPSPEWYARKHGYSNLTYLRNYQSGRIVKITISLKKQLINYASNNINAKLVHFSNDEVNLEWIQFQEKAQSTSYYPSHIQNITLNEREYIFWQEFDESDELNFYNSGVNESLMDSLEEQPIWNMRCITFDYEDFVTKSKSFKAKSSSSTFFGMWKTVSPWTIVNDHLINLKYLHSGHAKTWYIIPHLFTEKFEQLIKQIYCDKEALDLISTNKTIFIKPSLVVQNGIPIKKIHQKEGEFVVFFRGAYHMGFNHGYNILEEINI
jgi:hypothetical protein